MKLFLFLNLFLFSFILHSQNKYVNDSTIILKLKSVLPSNWYVSNNDSGFSITYCKSCMDIINKKKVNEYDVLDLDKLGYENFKIYGGDSIVERNIFGHPFVGFFFEGDSLHPYSKLDSTHPFRKRNKEILQQEFKANNVLKIDVVLKEVWSDSTRAKVKKNNDSIIDLIRKIKFLGKMNISEFEDLRLKVPVFWSGKTKSENLIKLPFESCWYNLSIFIYERNCSICDFYLFDRNDDFFMLNPKNELNNEYKMVFNQLKFCLGIKD